MAKHSLRQPKLLTLTLAVTLVQSACVTSYAELYDCEEDLVGSPIELEDLDSTMLLTHPAESILSTLESPMSATAGPDNRLFDTNPDLEGGSGEDVELTLNFASEGTFFDGRGAFCDEKEAEFLVEVVVRREEQVLFTGEALLTIARPTFGKKSVRMEEFEGDELLAFFGISAQQATPAADQEHHAILDVFAIDGEIDHVRLEVGNDSITTGNTTPLVEVLFQR